MAKYHYTGDVNLECGGSFFDLSTFADDYVEVIQVTDLGSAIGYDDAYLIERGSLYLGNPAHIKAALDSCGWINGDLDLATDDGKLMLCEAVLGYMSADNYYRETVVIGRDADMMHREGWKADKRLRAGTNLRNYVMREFGITLAKRPHPMIGTRVEIPAYADLWMRGARFGTIERVKVGKGNYLDPHDPRGATIYRVRLDHPKLQRKTFGFIADDCVIL